MIKLEFVIEWFNRIMVFVVFLGVLRISAILKKLNKKLEAE